MAKRVEPTHSKTFRQKCLVRLRKIACGKREFDNLTMTNTATLGEHLWQMSARPQIHHQSDVDS